jgi:hypothetical protein
MLDVLMDDVADTQKDKRFLDVLLQIPYSPRPRPDGLPSGRVPYYLFTTSVWTEIDKLAKRFPRHRELEEVLEFDYRQLLNTMRYACLVNSLPEILNRVEHDLYQPHNMHMMISGTMDLMCSPYFDISELSLIRQALWGGQVMGRIGNMVSTWEREVKEGDFTSGVFATAIEWGIIDASEITLVSPEELATLINTSGIIEYFLGKWESLRDELYTIADQVTSVDLKVFTSGLEELIRYHLGSRGLK